MSDQLRDLVDDIIRAQAESAAALDKRSRHLDERQKDMAVQIDALAEREATVAKREAQVQSVYGIAANRKARIEVLEHQLQRSEELRKAAEARERAARQEAQQLAVAFQVAQKISAECAAEDTEISVAESERERDMTNGEIVESEMDMLRRLVR